MVDDQQRPIESATVMLDGDPGLVPLFQQDNTSDAEGKAEFMLPERVLAHLPGMHVMVSLLGTSAERFLLDHDLGTELRLVVPNVGWLEARVEGPMRGVGLQVVRVDGNAAYGQRVARMLDEPIEHLAVGLGLHFQVQGWSGGERKIHSSVAGPQRAHEVVPVSFDFRRCRVALRLPDGEGGEQLRAMFLTKKTCARFFMDRGQDGGFTALVPLATDAWFVLVLGAASFEAGPRKFTTDVDFGLVRLEPMATAGVVELRHTDGALSHTPQVPSAFLFPTGERLQASLSTRLLFTSGKDEFGTRLASLRLFAGLEVRPQERQHYAEPAMIVVRDGEIARATLHRGAVFECVAKAPGPMSTMWLERVGDTERVHWQRSWFETDRVPAWRFEGLPPGEYRIVSDTVVFSPDRVTVPASSEQRVSVAVQPK